jgi:inorganic triphosphatase YgiF
LVGTYYDTPDLLLKQRNLSLRVRDIDHRHIQTVKRMGPNAGALFVRDEWESEVNGRAPNLGVIDDEDIRRQFVESGAAAALRPMFRTDVRRTVWMLRDTNAEIELALDVGNILSEKGGSAPICEAELELKSGDPRALFEVALALNERVDCTVGSRSKSDRGYALIRDEAPAAVKAVPVTLDRDVTVWEAFVAICRNCLVHLEANDPAARSGFDPEGIHQARVAIRRLRAAFKIFKSALPEDERAQFAKDLRWLQKQLGDARDLDVFAAGVVAPLLDRAPEDEALIDLKARVERARKSAYRKASEALQSGRYGRIRLALERWFAEPSASADVQISSRSIRWFAKRSIRKSQERVLSAGSDPASMPDAALHELRILGKQARYCVEFFSSLFADRRPRRHLKALIALQDCLGILNDGVVARHILARLDKEAEPLDPRVTPYVLGWFAARIHDERERLQEIWPRLSKVEDYWR